MDVSHDILEWIIKLVKEHKPDDEEIKEEKKRKEELSVERKEKLSAPEEATVRQDAEDIRTALQEQNENSGKIEELQEEAAKASRQIAALRVQNKNLRKGLKGYEQEAAEARREIAALRSREQHKNLDKERLRTGRLEILKNEQIETLRNSCHSLEEALREKEIEREKLQCKTSDEIRRRRAHHAFKLKQAYLQVKKLEEETNCLVCHVNRWNTVLHPCGHVLCDICAIRMERCPSCRQHLERTQKLYIQGV